MVGDVLPGEALVAPVAAADVEGGDATETASAGARLALVSTLVAFLAVLRRASSFLATSASETVCDGDCAKAAPEAATSRVIVKAMTRFMF
jgi:hypothetical protein